MENKEKLIPINIEDEMKSSYIDYSMSVIVSRALPDVRDGLKPVHRRVLYGMHDLGVKSTSAHKKSARIVGEVMGKYHPHGDSAIYDTMVRMAQDWSLRYMLVDGQGNFGSVDGDSPAAMRYTEARMQKISEEMLSDIEKDTVDYKLNFDDTLNEPTVLPTKIPALLVNGASGIAVGMATNIAPHNLTEVIDGTLEYIKDNSVDIDNLMNFVKAPDFPTGGIIHGYEGVKEAFHTGRGKVVLRGKAEIEELDGKESIIVTEIPYQVNKADMIKRIADLVNDKKLDGISTIRDESDRNGMRIVFVLKRDAIPNIVLNKLYKYSQLQSSFSVNSIALVNGRPMMLNLKDMIKHFVDHRHDVVVRRTKFELKKAEDRCHILEGLIIASDNIDEVISIIKASENAEDAKKKGATIIENKKVIDAKRNKKFWEVMLDDDTVLKSKILINAAGPWINDVLSKVIKLSSNKSIRLVKGSHIITESLYNQKKAFTLQNEDNRIIFVIPYKGEYSLIGTTETEVFSPENPKIDESEIDYLLNSVNKYFIKQISRDDVVSSYSGIRPLIEDFKEASKVTRDYIFDLNEDGSQAPLLSIYGGKLTTYRKLAENVLLTLNNHIPINKKNSWTAEQKL